MTMLPPTTDRKALRLNMALLLCVAQHGEPGNRPGNAAGLNVGQALRRTGADVSIRHCRPGYARSPRSNGRILRFPLRVQAAGVKTTRTPDLSVPRGRYRDSAMKIRFGAIGRHCH